MNNDSLLASIFPDTLVCLMKQRQDKIITLLNDNSKNATLALGAGVNGNAGMPTWNRLLDLLIASRISYPVFQQKEYVCPDGLPLKKPDVKSVFTEEDVLEVAEYIKNITNSDDAQIQAEELKLLVRSAITPTAGIFAQRDDDIVKRSERTDIAVAKLACKHFTNKIEFNETLPRKRSVITFNYDDLMEHYAESLFGCPAQAIYDGIIPDSSISLHVYHPHGYLPIVGKDKEKGLASREIVLSEESYYKLERFAYSWENFVIVRALHDSTCVFCGFSGSDHNFKRILRNLVLKNKLNSEGKDDEANHYLLFTINPIIEAILKSAGEKAFSEIKSDEDLEKCKDILRGRQGELCAYLSMKEAYWKMKGIAPIWTVYHKMSEYDDLHNVINSFC